MNVNKYNKRNTRIFIILSRHTHAHDTHTRTRNGR